MTVYEVSACLVGSEMCIRDSIQIAARYAGGGELTQRRSEVGQQGWVGSTCRQVKGEVELSFEGPTVSARGEVLQTRDGGASASVGANSSGAGKQRPAALTVVGERPSWVATARIG